MATKITPSKEYLRRFSSSLWDALDLEDCKPLMIVEGQQGTFPFTVIEMQHLAYGFLSGNGATAISTFFIVTPPKKSGNRRITWHPREYQVSVDCDHVYLVSPSKKVRPGDWEHLIQLTIDVADSLDDSVAEFASPDAYAPTYKPVGAGVFINAFWGLMCLFFSIFFLVCGLSGMFGMMKLRPTWSGSVTLGLQYLLVGVGAFWGSLYYYKKVKKRL